MSPAGADSYTDLSGLARLRAEARGDAAGARGEVGRQMEAMFVSLMLKSMREAGAALGDGTAGMHRDLYDSQLALEIARAAPLGLGQRVLAGMQDDGAQPVQARERQPFAAPARDASLPARDWAALRRALAQDPVAAASGPAPPAPAGAPAPAAPPAADWSSPEEFATQLWPAASRAASALGTRPEAVLAVAALETGWGRHLPLRADGTSSNNLFGIKAHGWRGEVTHSATLEFEQGAFARRVEAFRAYPSPTAAVEDFARFVSDNPRYREALASAGDPVAFVHALHRAGYATDPRYGEKLESLIHAEPMRRAAARAAAGPT